MAFCQYRGCLADERQSMHDGMVVGGCCPQNDRLAAMPGVQFGKPCLKIKRRTHGLSTVLQNPRNLRESSYICVSPFTCPVARTDSKHGPGPYAITAVPNLE